MSETKETTQEEKKLARTYKLTEKQIKKIAYISVISEKANLKKQAAVGEAIDYIWKNKYMGEYKKQLDERREELKEEKLYQIRKNLESKKDDPVIQETIDMVEELW
ncbi:MAG: hypothetical protein ACOCUI_02300, partial [bacterium]